MSKKIFFNLILIVYCQILGADRPKVPYKVMFCNDTTNLAICPSPYHAEGAPVTKEVIEASVDEICGIGIDAAIIEPGLGWVPFWQSKVYSPQEHFSWYENKFNIKIGDIPIGLISMAPALESIAKFLQDGGDFISVFVDRCRLKGISPIVSFRLNDPQLNETPDKWALRVSMYAISKFWDEHPEYRLGPNRDRSMDRCHNWAIQEVRDHKFAFIKEICENYDIDGLQLDFLRNPMYFDQNNTTSSLRRQIMTDFIRKVRNVLDETTPSGHYRYLGLRIPNSLQYEYATFDKLGLDLGVLSEIGVDFLTVSPFYNFIMNTDLPAIKKKAGRIPLYAVFTPHATHGREIVPEYKNNDRFYERVTKEQFYTAAHLAYSRGASGICTFNFVYYRELATFSARGPSHEPPFDVHQGFRWPEWLARQPQDYVMGNGTPPPFGPVPRILDFTEPQEFIMDMEPPAGGWFGMGKLRIISEMSMPADAMYDVELNGIKLESDTDIGSIYANPYPPLGTESNTRAWQVPSEVLKPGYNKIKVWTNSAKSVKVVLINLAIK